jgi:O-antigen/teichoic acid export membrane protein
MKGEPRFGFGLLYRVRSNKAFGKALSVSLLNQLVSSGTHFAIVLYLVRVMEKSDFGLYGLGFALMLVLAGLISSSVAVQFVVNVPDQPQEQRLDYALHHAIAVFLLGLGLVALGALVSAAPWRMVIGGASLREIMFPLALSAAFYSQRDLLMRVAYSERRETVVLVSSIAVSIGTATVFTLFWQAGQPLSVGHTLIALALGQAAGCLVALLLLPLPYRSFTVKGLGQAFLDCWGGGKWNFLTNVVYNVRTQAHNFVVAPLLGLGALAEINAARVLVTPAVMVIPPLSQVLMPRLAGKRGSDAPAMTRYAMTTIGGLATVAFLYAALLLALLPWVLPLVLGEAYQNAGVLVMAWCVVAVTLAVRNGLTLVLEVVRAFRDLLWANLAAAVSALVLVTALAIGLGSLGAIAALAIAELFLCTLLLKLLKRQLREPPISAGRAVNGIKGAD